MSLHGVVETHKERTESRIKENDLDQAVRKNEEFRATCQWERDRIESSRSRTGELDRFSILEKTVKEWGGSVEGRGRIGQGRKEGRRRVEREGGKGKGRRDCRAGCCCCC
ncbi:hypothetical protein WR25_10191 [Diploscapter pachys]|uniref:Uncharacterized protein n=1 Tax=Diploscapter pachys TaxID=2018661 RepID=A0A2A2KLV5_9BILA|nr:hypothetical protein WR25_10191 [Diploscapter pachys]